jgi:AbiV family abortive infection protein
MFTAEQKELLRIAEYKARDTARSHIDAAMKLYSGKDWPHSCFLAMTAIEEIGKGLQFHVASANDDQSVLEDLKRHRAKAMFVMAPIFWTGRIVRV